MRCFHVTTLISALKGREAPPPRHGVTTKELEKERRRQRQLQKREEHASRVKEVHYAPPGLDIHVVYIYIYVFL